MPRTPSAPVSEGDLHDASLTAAAPLRIPAGRGALSNADSRFDASRREAMDDGWGALDEEPPALKTTVTPDRARSVIARNDSPDIPFRQSINPYRGCEHGCVYCYARPSHAYLGLSPGLDFESRLYAKHDAAQLLEQELARPGHVPDPIALGANTDPYQPVERRLQITRAILQVLARHRHPFTIVTKSALVERDLDILAPLARDNLCAVYVSVTTLDRRLARSLEPRAAAPQRRLEAIRHLAEAGIPTGVIFAPVIPALNDHELEAVLEAAAAAGARCAGRVLLRLPHEVKVLFREWLATHAPLKAAHVMSLVRQARGGRDNDARFGARMTGSGDYAQLLGKRFELACKRLGLNREELALDRRSFRVPARAGDQLGLFDPA
jgi:DNA repair photolyase